MKSSFVSSASESFLQSCSKSSVSVEQADERRVLAERRGENTVNVRKCKMLRDGARKRGSHEHVKEMGKGGEQDAL
jgi:hypothetical protein